MKKTIYISIFVLLITLILFCFPYKRNDTSNDNLLMIDSFRVTERDFYKKNVFQNDKNILLDDFINAGILIKIANDSGFLAKEEIIKQLHFKELELRVKYIIQNRVPIEDVSESDIKKSFKRFNSRRLIIDYVWISDRFIGISNEIQELIRSGITIDQLKTNPEFKKWNKKGVVFSEKMILGPGTLIGKVERAACQLKEKEVKVVQTKSGYHIIKLQDEFLKNSSLNDEIDNVRHRIALANQIEKCDTILSESYLNGKIEINKKVLSALSFIEPCFTKDANIVAVYKADTFTYKDIDARIKKMPQALQALFKNKSTKAKALAALIMLENLDYYKNSGEKKLQEYRELLLVEYLIKRKLQTSNNKDTLRVLNHWFKEITPSNNPDLLSSLKKEQAIKELENDTSIASKCKAFKGKAPLLFKQNFGANTEDYLEPQGFENIQFLKINYNKLQDTPLMKQELQDNQLVAYGANFSLTAKALKSILEGLTPQTRLLISESGDVVKLIEYIANGKAPTSKIIINKTLLKDIDIVGESYDMTNGAYSEGEIVGSLFEVNITIEKLRCLVSEMPEKEKEKFFNEATRETALKQLLIRQFWLTMEKKHPIKDCHEFKAEFEKYKNWFIVNALYENKLCIKGVKTTDDELNCFIQNAVARLNAERIEQLLLNKASTIDIKINKKALKKLDIDIAKSKYIRYIKLYE